MDDDSIIFTIRKTRGKLLPNAYNGSSIAFLLSQNFAFHGIVSKNNDQDCHAISISPVEQSV